MPQQRATAISVWLTAAAVIVLQLSRPLSGLDMHVYWTSARDMAHGLSPYTDPRFVYPPFAAVLIAPLAHLNWPDARTLGSTVAVLAVLLTVLLSARALGVRLQSWRVALIAVVVVTGHLFFAAASLGNVSAVIALLLAGFYFATAREQDWVAGVLLGASLAVKPLLLPVLLVPLLWGRWRMLLATGVAALASTGIGSLLVPHSGWFWTRAIPYLWNAHPASFDPLNSTLSSVGHIAGWPEALVMAARVLAVVAAVVVAILVRLRRPRLDALGAISVGSAALLAQFCAGALTEDHFLLTLIPLLVTLVADESLLWPVVAWPAAVAVTGLVSAPSSWYGVGIRAQWSANTTVRLFGQLGLLVAFLLGAGGYGPATWRATHLAQTSLRSWPWSLASRSASDCAGSSAGCADGLTTPPGRATS